MKTIKTVRPVANPEPAPALSAIAAEAKRLGKGGLLVAGGHLAEAIGAPAHTPAGEAALLDFAEEHGLDVEHDGADGFLFTPRPDPAAHELT